MFSKEDSKRIRQEFWTRFGTTNPRKWLLYNTKIKNVTLKFTFTTKKAQVSIEDKIIRAYYYDKLLSLKTIITSEYLSAILFDSHYELENGKIISRIYVELCNVSIHNQNDWKQAMIFLEENMSKMETFFIQYKDFIDR